MTTPEERMRILRLIENGQISAEEGARLLGAMDESSRQERPAQSQWVRVRITDLRTSRQKVNVNIPVGLIGIGLKLGARFSIRSDTQVDMEHVLESIRHGAHGKLVDIEYLEEGERVELIVE